MDKDFDEWNRQKKYLNSQNKTFFFKEGEVWWCSIGINIDTEIFGKGKTFRRPVLILKKLSGKNFIGLPLSSKDKNGSWFANILVNGVSQTILLYQIRMFSTNRFQRRMATLDNNDFNHIKRKLEQLLKLS